MPALTRRRYPERQDCWHVYYGDVHVGTIARPITDQAMLRGIDVLIDRAKARKADLHPEKTE
jgi:hypothetical protein